MDPGTSQLRRPCFDPGVIAMANSGLLHLDRRPQRAGKVVPIVPSAPFRRPLSGVGPILGGGGHVAAAGSQPSRMKVRPCGWS